MFTVSPQMSNANLRWPITPPMTGPECTPTRSRRSATRLPLLRGSLDHREPEIDDASCMVIERLGQSARGHVGIADGLDLFEAARGHELVKAREESAEQPDDFVGWQDRRQPREPDDVGEEHGYSRVLVGDRPLTRRGGARRSIPEGR